MINGKTVLAIIPARGGSKRLPRKNILELGGKPLIAWTIEAGLKSSYIDNVIVSSDDDEILEVARRYGAEGVKRPPELASDTATTFDALKHTIDSLEVFDYVVLLQPTSPLRNQDQIDGALELLIEKEADAVISVCEMEHSPLWSNTLPDDGDMSGFLREEVLNKRSQDLPTYFRLNGAVYICKTDKLLSEKTFFVKGKVFAYVMKKENSIDIDDLYDFHLASALINLSRQEMDA